MKKRETTTAIPQARRRRLDQLVRLYRRTSAACAKSNDLLNRCSAIEEELFGISRGDTDRDQLIDNLEYASGGGANFTLEDVMDIWGEPNPKVFAPQQSGGSEQPVVQPSESDLKK